MKQITGFSKILMLKGSLITLLWLFALDVFAAGKELGGSQTLGAVASGLTNTFTQITNLITGMAYILGLGFAISAIFKFKQHKDNPTQIPVGTPMALLAVAAAMLFLPSVIDVTGKTLFKGGKVSGPTGTTL